MSKPEGRSGGCDFPCASLGEALTHLRRPPTPEAVRFKIQTVAGEVAQIAPYVDARLVFDRLDLVCGDRWTAKPEEVPLALRPRTCRPDGALHEAPLKNRFTGEVIEQPPIHIRCLLTAFGVTRQDVGEGETPKAAWSDAIKRAAVWFGVGRALYALGAPWLREGQEDGELRRNSSGKLIIDARTEAWLRDGYRRWLTMPRGRLFGEPLDHGDELGAPGFEAETAPAVADGAESEVDQGGGGDAAPELAAPDGPMVSGALRAVSDGSPGEPPATAHDRQKIVHWQQAGGYREETVAAIAELACGEKILERLGQEQVKRVAWLLELAAGGRVSQRTLAGVVTRATRRYDLGKGAEELERYLREKYDEVGLLGRREAA